MLFELPKFGFMCVGFESNGEFFVSADVPSFFLCNYNWTLFTLDYFKDSRSIFPGEFQLLQIIAKTSLIYKVSQSAI